MLIRNSLAKYEKLTMKTQVFWLLCCFVHGQWTSARGSPSKGAPVNGSPDKDFWILPLSLVNSQRQYWLKAAQAQLYSTLALDVVDL